MCKEKLLLSGNEAVARGAWEAGVKAGTGYPGTPSTEILENLHKYAGAVVMGEAASGVFACLVRGDGGEGLFCGFRG